MAGWGTTANGQASCALGYYSIANSYAELAIGRFNTIPSSPSPSTTAWNDADPLLVLGMGTSTSARADALVVFKDGKLKGFGPTNIFTGQMRIGGPTAPSANVALDVTGNSVISGTLSVGGLSIGGVSLPSVGSLLTTSAGNLAYHSRANDQIILGTTAPADTTAALIVGNGAGNHSFKIIKASGNVTSTGSGSFASLTATGNTTAASLTVTGISSFSGGIASFSAPISTTSNVAVAGQLSVGASNSVTGAGSAGIGANLDVSGANQFVIGRYNSNDSPNTSSWVSTDPLLVVGNGANSGSRSNALELKKNANLRSAGQGEFKEGLRVKPLGDLSMGSFTAGNNPASLDAGLQYPGE